MKEKIILEPISLSLIFEIRDRIIEFLNPDKIIIFGSATRLVFEGSAGDDVKMPHDVDLYVIKRGIRDVREAERKIDELFAGRFFALDVIVRTPEQVEYSLKGGNSFLSQQILAKGSVLYDKQLQTTLS